MFERETKVILAGLAIVAMTVIDDAPRQLAKAHEVTLATGATVNYTNWVNKAGKGCCNNHDCRPIPANFERTRNGQLEVFVIGEGVAAGQSEWCPIHSQHYLSKGNAPDGSQSHYCVWQQAGTTPCAQLLCYQPPAQY
ncbi:MAG: hypothetical protein GEU95_12595 [Rhizobiales bacterium]|nr:hypothetical protein [Hyphomicrobiales bacterium]